MSDRLALAHAIEDAGIPRAKAENVATAIAHFVEGGVATKAQLDAGKAELKADIQATEATLRAAFAAETARLDTRVERLDAKVERIGDRTFNRQGVLMAVVATLPFAALHLWPPR